MNTLRHPLAFLIAGTCCLAAQAHTPPARADIVAEYQDAVRTGDVMAPGDSGMKLNEMYPDRYPTRAQPSTRTRAQVVAELRDAIRTGDILAGGDSGIKENELHPRRQASAAGLAQGKTREQVRAETLEAIRTGDMPAAGDSGLKLNELYPQRYAKAISRDADRHRAMAQAPGGIPVQ